MQIARFGILALPVLLVACGHSGPVTPTLSVTCDGSLTLAGATGIDLKPVSSGGAVLSFPDPANAGQTGSVTLAPGHVCAIAPVTPIKADKDGS